MPSSGVFVTLYDEATLNLYLDRGLYGFLMKPVHAEVGSRSRHYQALGDYACVREGTHVFFFLKRRIVYGGQAIGSRQFGSFYLNGQHSPMARRARAGLCWDESVRACYGATAEPGVFVVPAIRETAKERSQPYLIRFEDRLGLKGKAISSDLLYWKLGEYGFPLPSNSIQGMSFCTLTPRETELALSLLKHNPDTTFPGVSSEPVCLRGEPPLFQPDLGVRDLAAGFRNGLFVNEAHVEAEILANPQLQPREMRPGTGDTLCRQVPICPFKPYQMDRADICYYSDEPIADGALPNVIIELKLRRAGQSAVDQVARYLEWLHKVTEHGEAARVRAYVLAPSYSRNVHVTRYADQIRLLTP